MNNNPVDTAHMNANRKPEPEEDESREVTHASFRIKVGQVGFYRRMIYHFYENGLIHEPRLSLLAKACLNIAANIYAKFEEEARANYIQKILAQERGSYLPSYQQYQSQQAVAMGEYLKLDASDVVPPELRRSPPVNKTKEPEWYG